MLKEAEEFINNVTGLYGPKRDLYKVRSKIYEILDDYELAFKAKIIQDKYTDTLSDIGFDEQAFKYDYNLMIDSLAREKEVKLNAKLYKSNSESRFYFLALIIVSIIFFSIFLIYRFNKRVQITKVESERKKLAYQVQLQEAELNVLKSEEKVLTANLELSAKRNELEDIKQMLEEHLESANDPQFNRLKFIE